LLIDTVSLSVFPQLDDNYEGWVYIICISAILFPHHFDKSCRKCVFSLLIVSGSINGSRVTHNSRLTLNMISQQWFERPFWH